VASQGGFTSMLLVVLSYVSLLKCYINRVWVTIRENIKITPKESLGCSELKKHMPWFNEACSELLGQRKQAKLLWLQDPSEINGDNVKNLRCEVSRHFRNEKREYLKDKINKLGINSKNKNIRGQYRGKNEFKEGLPTWK
jgi:hypothetical protein